MAVAWLEWNGVLYWAVHERSEYEPRSVVSCLIDGVWTLVPGSAHFILRSRIFTTQTPTELCRGVVIVCAKRMTHVSDVPDEIVQRMRDATSAVQVWPEDALLQTPQSYALLPGPFAGTVRAEQSRSIECWLLSRDGRLLATAKNSAGRHRLRHAEMNVLVQWWQRETRGLPKGGRLIVTLEPCAMCAGALWECLEDRSDFTVEFLEPDLGRAASRSVLRRHSMLRQCLNFSQGG